MPGRKEQRGAANAAERVDFINSFLLILIFLREDIFCFGREILSFMLIINEDTPNSPVRRGSKGSFTGRLKVSKPRKPASMKIMRGDIISFSENIKKRDTKIRINGIISFIKL